VNGVAVAEWVASASSDPSPLTVRHDSKGEYLLIDTLEGAHTASPGDWIIRGVKGEFYPCKPDIFTQTYEPALNPSSNDADTPAVAPSSGDVVAEYHDLANALQAAAFREGTHEHNERAKDFRIKADAERNRAAREKLDALVIRALSRQTDVVVTEGASASRQAGSSVSET
jgi:hypothetical protein